MMPPPADASPFASVLSPIGAQLASPLHDQYLLSPLDHHRVRLTGQMHKIWHRPRWIRPLLVLLSWWSILVPETGTNVPADMLVAVGYDRRGRPCQVWERCFAFGRRRRRFTSVMVYDARRRTVVERLGPGGLIQVPWRMRIMATGGLRIDVEGLWLGRFRLPRAISADVIAIEQALDARTVQIELVVNHRLLGPVFGYEGRFQADREPLS